MIFCSPSWNTVIIKTMSDLKKSTLYAEMSSILSEEWAESFTSKWGCETAEKVFRKGFDLAIHKGYLKFQEVTLLCMKEAVELAAKGEQVNYQKIFNERFWH